MGTTRNWTKSEMMDQTSKFPFENVVIMFMRRFNELRKVSGNQIYRPPWNGTLMRSFVVRIKQV